VRRGLAARKARSNGTERQVDVYLNPRDPHGYLLLQVLPSLGERFDLTFRYHTVATLQDDMFPEQALWQSWAIADARDLARLYRLDFPDHDPALPEPAVRNAACGMASAEDQPDFADQALEILRSLWHGEVPADETTPPESTEQRIALNEERLHEAGHYLGSMLHYEGEWYWGWTGLITWNGA